MSIVHMRPLARPVRLMKKVLFERWKLLKLIRMLCLSIAVLFEFLGLKSLSAKGLI